MTAIVDLRSKIRAVLGTAVDTSSWPDDLLDASVRQALPFLAEHLPPDEETIVCTAGCEQDLSALTDLYQIAAIGWPWNDDEGIFRHVPWRPLGKRQIYMEGASRLLGMGCACATGKTSRSPGLTALRSLRFHLNVWICWSPVRQATRFLPGCARLGRTRLRPKQPRTGMPRLLGIFSPGSALAVSSSAHWHP